MCIESMFFQGFGLNDGNKKQQAGRLSFNIYTYRGKIEG